MIGTAIGARALGDAGLRDWASEWGAPGAGGAPAVLAAAERAAGVAVPVPERTSAAAGVAAVTIIKQEGVRTWA